MKIISDDKNLSFIKFYFLFVLLSFLNPTIPITAYSLTLMMRFFIAGSIES
jgi:hypothetical protein